MGATTYRQITIITHALDPALARKQRAMRDGDNAELLLAQQIIDWCIEAEPRCLELYAHRDWDRFNRIIEAERRRDAAQHLAADISAA